MVGLGSTLDHLIPMGHNNFQELSLILMMSINVSHNNLKPVLNFSMVQIKFVSRKLT